MVELDELIARLPRTVRARPNVVVCRSFAGLTADETAEALGISVRTVHSDWASDAVGWPRTLHKATQTGRRPTLVFH